MDWQLDLYIYFFVLPHFWHRLAEGRGGDTISKCVAISRTIKAKLQWGANSLVWASIWLLLKNETHSSSHLAPFLSPSFMLLSQKPVGPALITPQQLSFSHMYMCMPQGYALKWFGRSEGTNQQILFYFLTCTVHRLSCNVLDDSVSTSIFLWCARQALHFKAR